MELPLIALHHRLLVGIFHTCWMQIGSDTDPQTGARCSCACHYFVGDFCILETVPCNKPENHKNHQKSPFIHCRPLESQRQIYV